MNEGSAKQQIVEGIKVNTNILVTVSDSPSVDELSAALGLTLLLNKLDKRATAIFSGAIPPAITFLDPEKTFEGTVDSLRDFIIALDKEKADHLRYKVDGDVVKIFITPYRTQLSNKDLQFSQGDYNVEMVIALGVKEQDHLDKALTAHGRILHDATVATISAGAEPSKMGSIDWRDAAASSLCEMLISLCEALKDDSPLLDETTATAFLTGIVSATDRFSNDRTSSRVMTMAAQLMAAGANQQLIAAKLQDAHDISPKANTQSDAKSSDSDTTGKDSRSKKEKKKKDDNSLQIERDKENKAADESKKDDTSTDKEEPAGNQEAAAVASALDQAEPAKDVEKELSDQLDAALPSISESATSPQDLQKELDEALAVDTPDTTTDTPDQAVDTPAGDEVAVPVPTPDGAPATGIFQAPAGDDGMPGFEPLDVPVNDAPAPSTVSGAIDARPGRAYIESDAPANFDAPVDNIIENTTDADQFIDPFSAPLPDLRDGKDITPITDDNGQQPPANVVADTTFQAPTLEELEKAAMPPLPPNDLPPLPPLPDLSGASLPPLPPPPPPPIFDQPAASATPAQTGAISNDKLGDIFGDTPAPVDTPPAPTEPPKPGQFQIPGQ